MNSISTRVAVLYGAEQVSVQEIQAQLKERFEVRPTNNLLLPENLEFLGDIDLLLYNLAVVTEEERNRMRQVCQYCHSRKIPVILLVNCQEIEWPSVIHAYREGLTDCCILPGQLSILPQIVDLHLKKADKPYPTEVLPLGSNIFDRFINVLSGGARTAETSTIHVQFFGVFKIWINGKPMEMPSQQKVRSILAWLLLFGQKSHHRDKMATIFWPDLDIKSARNNLSVNLTALRKCFVPYLEGELLYLDCDCYRLNPNLTISSDIQTLRLKENQVKEILARGRREDATQIFVEMRKMTTFELLEDLLREPWTITYREDYREKSNILLESLSNYYSEHAEYELALECLKSALHIDDTQEAVHLKIAQTYIAQGKTSKAIQQKDLCARILQEKLDVNKTSRHWDELLKQGQAKIA